jgi:multimeric flavodoxin WrbA
MKVLLVNGSPKPNGNTFIALEEVAKTLESEGIETEIFQIGNKPVRGCIDCQTCHKTGSGRCIFNDDVCNSLCEKAATADAFVFGAPVYYGQPDGAILALLQRAFYADSKDFAYKPVASVAVCRRGGATAALNTMNMAYQIMNMPLVTSQYWNLVFGRDVGEVLQDSEGMQTMRTLGHNMAWMLKKFKGEPASDRPKEEAPWQPLNFIR